MFCPECGAKLNDGSTFCGSCGKKIEAQPQVNQNEKPLENAQVASSSNVPAPKKKGGAAKVIIPIIVGVLALGVAAIIAIIVIVGVVLGNGGKDEPVPEVSTEYYSEEVTVSVTEEETELESKYSTADAEKFYLDLVEKHGGIEFYYIASTNETNVHNMRLDLTGVDYVSTYVADGNDYSDVILDGVSVFDTLTDEEYDVLLFNGANSGYYYFIFKVDDINAFFDSIWEPGRFTAEDFVGNSEYDTYISESGYLFYGIGPQGFGNDAYKTKVISSKAIDGGFELKVKLIDAYVDMGETDAMIYDYYASNMIGTYYAGDVDISTIDFDEILSGAMITEDDITTLTVTIVETDEGLRLESIR